MTKNTHTEGTSSTTTAPTTTAPAGTTSPAHLLVLLAAVFMSILDFFIVNVALPDIARSLHSTANRTEWVVSSYGLAFAVLLIAGGRLGDRHGRRRTFRIGLVIFVAASIGCGLAPSLPFLVVARVVQGGASALLIPSVLGSISAVFTGEAFRRAISRYALAMALAAAVGQVLGGLLITWNPAGLGWRLIFLINVPIGLLTLLASGLVPRTHGAGARRLDLPGIALIGAALLALMLPLAEGRSANWAPWTWFCLVAGLLLGAGAVRQQTSRARRHGDALIDPAVFGDRSLVAGLVSIVVYQTNQPGLYFVLAHYLQSGRGLTPLQSGLLFTALVVGYIPASLLAPALHHRFGRRVIWLGAVLLLVGYLGLWGVTGPTGRQPSFTVLGGIFVLLGIGQGLVQIVLTVIVMQRVPPDHGGAVGGVVSTAQQVGGSFGVVIAGTLFLSRPDPDTGLAMTALLFCAVVTATALLALAIPRRGARSLAGPGRAGAGQRLDSPG